MWIFEISKNLFFYRTPPVAAFVYIFVSLFINWKIFHQSNLPLQSRKNGEIFFISIRIWLHFHKMRNISSLPSISMKCKKVMFFSSLYIFLFIFTNWIVFHKCGLFPRSGKYFTNVLYILQVNKCLMNCITAK